MNENRRDFVGLMLVTPAVAFGSQANSALEIGVVGCGGRGNYIGGFFREYTGARVTAVADPFEERMDAARKNMESPGAEGFGGIDGYKRMLDKKLDAVLVMSPPYFHPEQAAAAVAAGKNVYIAKPIAVDVPGCNRFLEAGRAARKKNLSFLVDFQTRVQPVFMEAARRVHTGEIGDPVLGHVYYHAGRLRPQNKPGMSADQARLANWVFDKVLSGDIIVEQNIHVLDCANWYLQGHPAKAAGSCGRKARVDVGDCNDHFIVNFWYPNGVKVDFSSAQFTKGYGDLCIRVYGSLGTLDSHYNGSLAITGDHPWPGNSGAKDDTFKAGAITNVKAFTEAVRAGKAVNNAEASVESNLTAILGRMAAYRESTVTWEEMMKGAERLEARLSI